ncbi:MAG: hypothetical protein U0105_26340 [Candidatus Obscuribacterales bacterium]
MRVEPNFFDANERTRSVLAPPSVWNDILEMLYRPPRSGEPRSDSTPATNNGNDTQGPEGEGEGEGATYLCAFEENEGGDGSDRLAALPEAARPLVRELQNLLISVAPSIDVETMSSMVRLMPPAQREALITLLRPVINQTLQNGSNRFPADVRQRLTDELNAGRIPPELLTGVQGPGAQGRQRISEFLTTALRDEQQRGELGPVTRAMHAGVVAWLNRDSETLLREWVRQTPDLPPAGSPLRVPPGTEWTDVVARLREDTPEARNYIRQLFQNSPLSTAVNFQLDTADRRSQLRTSIDGIAAALDWRRRAIPALDNLMQTSLQSDTRNTLGFLAQQGNPRPEWAPTEGMDRQMWYSAAGHRGEQARLATNIVQIILGMRGMNGGAGYPPVTPNRPDPFGPDFPGTVTRRPDGSLDVRLNLPPTLSPSPENELYYQQLQRWTDQYRFVIDDFMRMFDRAHQQFGLLSFANVPVTGRAPDGTPQGAYYNLACPRFSARRVGDQIEITQTTYYYNSPWYNPHDIFGFPVHVDPPPPRPGDPPRAPQRVGLNDLVPVMTNTGITLVRGEDLPAFASGAFRNHHGQRAISIGFDVAMCLNAGTRAVGFLRAGASVAEREVARLALRQAVHNGLLGASSVLTSSWWQNRDLPPPLRILPDARNAWFMFEMVRSLPGALLNIGRVTPFLGRLPWIQGAAAEAGSAASTLEHIIRGSRWTRAGDLGARALTSASELGLLGLAAFGRRDVPNLPQPADVIRFGHQSNLEQASINFLSGAVANLSNGQRIAALDGIVDAVRRYRPNMPPAERDRLLSDLNTTVNNTNAPPRERITAAMATVLVLNQEQQPAPRQLTPAQQEQWDRAKAVLEQIMRSGQLSPGDRLVCAQGLMATNSINIHNYAELCRQIARDRDADPAVRQQAVFGLGIALMVTREAERNLRDGPERSAYLARSFNTTAADIEQELVALGSGRHNATDDMRVAAVYTMHALNRDNRGQAETMLTGMLNWFQQPRQPGQFASHFAGILRDNLNAPQPAQDTPANLRVWFENRLAAAGALRVLASDAEFMQRININVTMPQVIENLVDVADRASLQPETVAQAILSLGDMRGLNPGQITRVVNALNTIMSTTPFSDDQRRALTIIKERLLEAVPDVLQHASPADRRALIDSIAAIINPTAGAQFAATSPELRAAAIRTLSRLHAQQPLPDAIISLIANRASYRPGENGGTPTAQDSSPLVRQVAFEALRRMGYGARDAAGVDLNAIARSWTANDTDLALRMMATNWLQVAGQQQLPDRAAIDQAGRANPEIPRVSTPITPNVNGIRQWLTSNFGPLINTPTGVDGSIDGARAERDPIEDLLNMFDVRRPDIFGVRPDIDGRFRNTPGIVVSPENARLVRGAMAAYVSDLNRLFQLAQTNSGAQSEQARQAVFWIATGGWREFPQRYRDAVAILSAQVLQQLAQGNNSAQGRAWLENLLESNDASPEARFIALNGLRTSRDNTTNSAYQGRYTALLESVFSQMVGQRPTGESARYHYALLQEVMHDLAFDSNLRSPFFISRLEAMSRDNTLPTDVRQYANVCLGRLLGWSNATAHAWNDRPNPAGNTAAARAQHLEDGIRNPGNGDIRLIEAIFNSVRGLPIQNDDPRLAHLFGLIWNPSENSLRSQIAACRAAFRMTPAADANPATIQQIQQIQRLAILRLAQISEFGPRNPANGVGWVYQREARAMLDEIVFTGATDTVRAERQRLVDEMTTRARNLRNGVAPVMTEVRNVLSSPLGQTLLGAGDAAEANLRLGNLRAIAQNNPQLRNVDTVALLVQSLNDFRNGQYGPWRPNGPAFAQMETELSTILQDTNMDRRVSLAAAIHVLTSATPSPFSQQVRERALDALVRISNQEVQTNPLWRQEAQHYVNLILTNNAYATYRDYITCQGRPEPLRPVQR